MQTPSSSTTVYHLEMCDPQAFRPKAGPDGFEVVRVTPPKPDLNRRFYCSVGSEWKWTDRLQWSEEDWHRYVHRDAVATWVGECHGQAVGYFELAAQDEGNIQIAYFGLLPEYVGRGMGGALLSAAIERAWDAPDTRRVWVHTCTHDHKHALNNYRRRGFEIFKTEHIAARV